MLEERKDLDDESLFLILALAILVKHDNNEVSPLEVIMLQSMQWISIKIVKVTISPQFINYMVIME